MRRWRPRRASVAAAGSPAAAAELLAEGGFDAVRHRAVAERAGLPLASTTYYFGSLDELVTAACEPTSAEPSWSRPGPPLDTAGPGDDPRAEVVLDLLLGPRSRTGGLDAVLLQFERLVGSGRRPYLAGLMRPTSAPRSTPCSPRPCTAPGTTPARSRRCAGSSPWSTAPWSPR